MKTKKFKFAVVSDTHIGCDTSRLDLLHNFYKKAKKRGSNIVIHAGDISDGTMIYRGQEHALIDNTQQKQAKRIIEEYPDKLETYYITGNHDLKNKEIDIASVISNGMDIDDMGELKHLDGRKDMHYLGRYLSRMRLPGDIDVDIVHPWGGGAYARSYPAQKYLRNINKKMIPDILIMGHNHSADYLRPQGVHVIMAGSFQDVNDYAVRKGIQLDLGGWLIEYQIIKDGEIWHMKPEFVEYESKGVWDVPKKLFKDD